MQKAAILLSALGLVGAGGAWASDLDLTEFKAASAPVPYYAAPSWSVVGSLSPTLTDNALFSRDNRRSDLYYEPDVSLRLDGNLTNDLSYRFYARTQYDAFATEKDGNAAVARLGARLTENWDGWRFSAIYENRYDFDGVYRDLAFISHDVMGSVARDFRVDNVTLSPLLLLTYRFSDLAEARRWRFDAVLGIEIMLAPKWSIVSTPLFEAFWFTDGLNTGRRDQIYSADVGLKYNFASNLSLTTTVLYEVRTSNVAVRRYRDLRIGPRLDFAF
ncbi:outer membrane beta-barrel protein [Bradyrhizobium sp. CCGUVB1N3]|uniref:outer membrane beta-barrel protein n=1 Tax=Bradyrhizobium sp. CCGUVB1N3 TaxID=2949629 RepID=UPI0020B3F7B0|nr:outer membrane beta-barrel protein [Bradyrhizobium sp. CCGUVB1N3]MCP3470803.1 outer membrane beta-barrel protein [Bradyrhizobium sp. CCGUVB1N3]